MAKLVREELAPDKRNALLTALMNTQVLQEITEKDLKPKSMIKRAYNKGGLEKYMLYLIDEIISTYSNPVAINDPYEH